MVSLNRIRDIISRSSLIIIFIIFSRGAWGQTPLVISGLKLLGTRSWIRVEWQSRGSSIKGFNIYWSTKDKKPKNPSAIIGPDETRYYIQGIQKETFYYVWVEGFNKVSKSKTAFGKVFTTIKWSLNPAEANNLSPSSSSVVPKGMKLFWHDEFNDLHLNRNKWFTDYYSTIDLLRKTDFQGLLHDSLPQAAYKLNGRYIDLFVNDSFPPKSFENGKRISSIQTYDWSTNENLLDDSRGGYFEVRVRRGSAGHPQGLNTAFWFDSPGPDLKYYLPVGAMVDGTKGIRPHGQLFEIDMFENLNAQFVMHGIVDSKGHFIHNLATDIAGNYVPAEYLPGRKWVTFGLLWTPVSIKHYINGELIKSYNNKHHIYSPDHIMNLLLGSYGKGGSVNLEVDYIRYYRWPISDTNELPNPGFEDNTTLLPWEGTGTLSTSSRRSGKYGLLLKPHQHIEQYVYLDNNVNYVLKYWAKGRSTLHVEVDNVQQVTGNLEYPITLVKSYSAAFRQGFLGFRTKKMYSKNMRTVRISFYNAGNTDLSIDDVSIRKFNE